MPSKFLLSHLREADWLDSARARAYLRILFFVQLAGLVILVLAAQGGLDSRGEPLGTDFVSFWTAARMALSGAPASVYDAATHHAAEQAAFGPALGWYAFFYPPVFLLYVLPLGALPYFGALAVWLGGTLAAYAVVLRRFGAGLMPLLAFPAVLTTLGHGQNAFLSTALFGGGVLLLSARPFAAGLCFAALCYKPQLAVLIPFGLLVAGRWRALAGMVVGGVLLVGAALAAFGWETWRAFFAESALARATLELGLVEPEKMQSFFAALRLLGAPLGFAYAAQIALSVAVAAALALLLRRTRDEQMQGALMAVAALLVTPFVLDYDLTLLAVPLAVLFAQARASSFAPYEKSILLVAFMLPAFSRALAQYAHLPLAPLVLVLLFAALARRAWAARA